MAVQTGPERASASPTTGATAPGTPARPGMGDSLRRLGSVQKSTVGVPAYMRWVNRPVGGLLAVVSHRLGLTPTQVTGVSALLSFGGILALATLRPSALTAVLVGLALALGFAFDSADGQLARLRGGGTLAGEWLDHVVDAVKSSSLHAAVAISLYRFTDLDHPAVLLLPLAYGVVGLTQYFGMMLRDQLLRTRKVPAPAGTPRPAPEQGSLLKAVLLLPVDYGVLCLVFFLLAWTTAFLWAYGALLVLTAAFAVHSLSKAYRSLVRASASS
ncbi:phosphatidylglycerophosphate synthase [Motilibacter peucedani]|uniref:Phosphatidylglycerophosphate synthase n=1 Tax=Motilibacter peucedani TaxID=598650 RepID=A0A420XLP3_9ACTN|nr:CDP-alcohol phosphatidyltransferase family protein [Motilibacter peucedani]RKS71336.1 phosphatidylglycerophosphate synthase [Motilibacter peucedani]